MLLKRPIRTRFRYGYPTRGNLATHRNSQAHSSKGTRSLHSGRSQNAPTACRHTVSGTISLPSRGTFHLSLTVLVRYRSPGSIQAWRVVPPDSHGIPRAPCYLGSRPGGTELSPTGLLPSTVARSHDVRLALYFLTPREGGSLPRAVPRPRPRNACRLSHATGLASSAFAHHYSRNHGCLLFLRVMRCFTSPRTPPSPYVFRRG